jgi:hypothetical protein
LQGFGDAIGLGKGFDGTLIVRNSFFSGGTNSVSLSTGILKVISSELDGPVFGAVICVADYDENGAALADGTGDSGGCI